MSSYPYISFTNIFNPNDFTEIDGSLSLADADARYFKISGGIISGFSTFLNSLNIIGTLSINSVPIDLSLISGITPGLATASKALIVDSSRNITNINSLSTTSLILNGVSISSSDLSLISGITPGLATASKALIVDSSRNITNINSLSTTSLIVNGVSIASSDLAYLSGITPGTVTASKAVVVDANKDITGLNIISSNGIALTPTNYTLTSPNIPGCLWRNNSSRLCAFREIDTNNWSWGYSGGGVWNDIVVMSNSTYRITINGDLNYTGSLRSSGTIVLDSSRNLSVADITANDITATTSINSPLAHIRDNAQSNNTRIEYLSFGRSSSGSDHGAWSIMNYYSSTLQGDSNYFTLSPRLRTGLNTGFGMVMTQNGNVSFQDKNANAGAGGFKIQSNIIACVDIQGGITRTIGAGHGYLQANSGSPAAYNASSVSTRIGLWVENSIWTGDKLYSSSDNRIKRDIKTIPLDEAKKLLNINAFSYRWKKDTEDHMPDIGFLAQDFLENKLEKIVSFCPSSDKKTFPLGYFYGLEYQKVCVYQNELIKDLYVQIEELKKKIKLVKT